MYFRLQVNIGCVYGEDHDRRNVHLLFLRQGSFGKQYRQNGADGRKDGRGISQYFL